jgi:hypothetical protein
VINVIHIVSRVSEGFSLQPPRVRNAVGNSWKGEDAFFVASEFLGPLPPMVAQDLAGQLPDETEQRRLQRPLTVGASVFGG